MGCATFNILLFLPLPRSSNNSRCHLYPSTSRLLLLIGNGLSGTLSGPGIGLGPLTANRQTHSMPDSAITPNFNKTLYVKCNLSSQVTFNGIFLFNGFAEFADLIICQIAYACIGINTCFPEYLQRATSPYPEDIRQADFNSFSLGKSTPAIRANSLHPPIG